MKDKPIELFTKTLLLILKIYNIGIVDPKSVAFVKEEEIISSSSIPKENLVPRRDFLKPQMMKGLSINVKRNPRKLILPSLKLNDMVIIEI